MEQWLLTVEGEMRIEEKNEKTPIVKPVVR